MRRTLVALLLIAAVAGIRSPARAQEPPHHQMGAVEDYYYPHLHNIVWDPADPSRVFAASPVGGWRSADGGRTWAALSPATPNLHYGRALLDPAARTLYLYRWGDPGLYASADFGATWPLRSAAMYYDLALAPGGLYAIHGDWRLRHSTDGGGSWRDLAQPVDPPGPAALAATPDGALFVATAGRLLRSTDGGASWQPSGEWPDAAPPRRLLVAPDGALVALPASADTPSVSARALWRSADGRSWAAAPIPAARIAVAAPGPDGSLYAGSDDGHVWRIAEPARWSEPAAWRELPVQLARPIHLRDDIPYTPAITEISPGPDGAVLIGTIHGVYRAPTPAGPALLRARGLLPTAALPSAAAPPTPGGRFFPETGHSLREPFLAAWARLGGVASLGLPRTEPFLERNLDSGADEIVQYFERGRLGHPPARPAQISLARLGPPLLAESGGPAPREAPRPGCAYFQATGFNLCGQLREAWRRAGGLPALGLPIAPAESLDAGERQWFERGRLERAPAGPPTLALVGSEELQARGWIP